MSTSIRDLQQKSKLPVNQAGGSTVAAFFEQNKGTIAALLPKHVTADRMMKIALGAIRTTPKLQEATSQSLFGAIVTCAQLGLEPNTPAGHAYLIPFGKGQGAQRKTEVQVIIGYRGLIDLARRSGQIVSISAHAVFEQDKFSYEYGLEEHCKHVPAEGDRGEITHFYAVAKLVGGGYAFEVMSRDAVELIRNNSSNWKTAVKFNNTAKSIWTLHFEEMGRKTAIRKLYKYLPTSIEMATADVLDAKSSTGESQDNSHVFDGEFTVEAVSNNYCDEGANVPATDSNGEIFDPEKHTAVDRFNKDGSFAKRRARTTIKNEAVTSQGIPVAENQPQADPLQLYVETMQSSKDVESLSNAREMANNPDANLSEEQLTSLDGFFQLFKERLTAGNNEFGDME